MTKLRARLGDIEFDYDGPEEFLRDELLKLLTQFASLSPVKLPTKQGESAGSFDAPDDEELSVSTLAQRLSVSSGPDLIVAAALSYVLAGTQSFTKKQLRDRTRDAKAYFKASHASNFDHSVARLVKNGRLSHTGGENYALPASERTRLNARLAAGVA